MKPYRVTLVTSEAKDLSELGPVLNPEQAAEAMRPHFGDPSREHLVVLYLDHGAKPLACETVAVGSLAACAHSPRAILRAAIALQADGIIVGHNHPSGNVAPSPEDEQATARLAEACKLVEVYLVDSIIMGHEGKYTSLRQMAEIQAIRAKV